MQSAMLNPSHIILKWSSLLYDHHYCIIRKTLLPHWTNELELMIELRKMAQAEKI